MAKVANYKTWLAGKTSTAKTRQAWVKAGGTPNAPVRKVLPKTKAPTDFLGGSVGPGSKVPNYGFAGAIDPSFGGSPFNIPTDAHLIGTYKDPNLGNLSGAYDMLTPIKRPGGGFDVYGAPKDLTPQWGKDYLSSLDTREAQQKAYNTGQVQPWLSSVLGAANNVNTQAQTGLANLLSGVNTGITNALKTGPGATPMSQTGGIAADPGAEAELAANKAAAGGLQANIGGGAYNAALGQLAPQSAQAGVESAFVQGQLRLPGEYAKQRADFTQKLGELSTQLQENRTNRELQRQQALEGQREFGIQTQLTREQTRATAQQNAMQNLIDKKALGLKVTQTEIDKAYKEARLGQFDTANEIAQQNADTAETRANTAGTNAAAKGHETVAQREKRIRDFTASIPELISGKRKSRQVPVDPNNPKGAKKTVYDADPATKNSLADIANTMLTTQKFTPAETWRQLHPYITRARKDVDAKISGRGLKFAQTQEGRYFNNSLGHILMQMVQNAKGGNLSEKLKTVSAYTKYPVDELRDWVHLGINPQHK
jgi:hypothetical protein